MLSDILSTMFLYQRPTIGPSIDVAVTATAGYTEIVQSGRYIIQNLGPKICYLRMFPNGAGYAASIKDMPLFPFGSGDMSSIIVQVGLIDVKMVSTGIGGGHPKDARYLHHICGSTETANLRVTRLTKD
jgi:hypothetical protein